MKKLVIYTLLAISILLAGCKDSTTKGKADLSGDKKIATITKSDAELLSGLRKAVQEIEASTLDVLVTDKVVTDAMSRCASYNVSPSWDANTYARHGIFDAKLEPIFNGHQADYWNSLYAAYSTGDPKYYANDAKFPMAGISILEQFREKLMEKARVHLKNPENLLKLYTVKKEIAIKKIKSMPGEERNKFLTWLKNAKSAMVIFGDEKFQKSYQAYSTSHDQ